ncbi:MAG: hypothetical protein GC201_16360 [Alphaproteobacteria bacterium]|nr:hypothetical protein [Alphaproteobacteria bacterium]
MRLLEPLRRMLGDREFERALEACPDDPELINPSQGLNETRNASHQAAAALVRQYRYAEALPYYLRIVVMDGMGAMHCRLEDDGHLVWHWDERLAVQAHGIMKAIAKTANFYGYSIDDLERDYFAQAPAVMAMLQDLHPPHQPADIWPAARGYILEHMETGTKWRPPKGAG